MLSGLAPGGVAIFTIGGTEAPSETRNCHMGPPTCHATPGIARTLEIVAEAGSVCGHLEYDQHPDLHVYLVFQRT